MSKVERVGFGVVICRGCGRSIQGDPVIYKVAKLTKQPHNKNRKYQLLANYCEQCYVKINTN